MSRSRPRPVPGGPVPGGFGGRVNLTVPLANLTGLADRPGAISGIGPIDPWLARDLAAAAARNPNAITRTLERKLDSSSDLRQRGSISGGEVQVL